MMRTPNQYHEQVARDDNAENEHARAEAVKTSGVTGSSAITNFIAELFRIEVPWIHGLDFMHLPFCVSAR
jgi:hypothetical protein